MSINGLFNLNVSKTSELELEELAKLQILTPDKTELYTIESENSDKIENTATNDTSINGTYKRINQLLAKLAPFKSEDSNLNSLLDDRTDITNKLLSKKSELTNEDDPQKQLQILKEIEKLIEEEIKKDKEILKYIKKNSDYDFVSPCLDEAIKKHEKAFETFKKENAQKEKDLKVNNNANNANNVANANGGGGNVDGANGNGPVAQAQQQTKETTDEASAVEEQVAQMNFNLPQSNLQNLDNMNLKEMEELNKGLDMTIHASRQEVGRVESELGGAVTSAENNVTKAIDDIANAINENNKEISSLISTHKEISSNITTTKTSIDAQKTAINTAQTNIQTTSSALASLVPPDPAAFTYTTTGTDEKGKTVVVTHFDSAGYSAALSAYNQQKSELTTQLNQAKEDLAKAKEEKAKLEIQLNDLYSQQQATEASLVTACRNDERLNGFAQKLETASSEVASARTEYTTKMTAAQAHLEQMEANKIELATKLNEKREFARIQEQKLIQMNADWQLAKDEQGLFGKFWDGVKNIVGHENGSQAIDEKIQALNEKAQNGEEITQDEIIALQEAINNYKTKQNESVNEQTKNISGAVAGSAGSFLGAKAGAAVGSAIAPGIGTIIGGAIGLGIGAVAGWFTGGALNVGAKQVENMTDNVKGNSWKTGEMQEDAKEGAKNGALSGGVGGLFGWFQGIAKAAKTAANLADDVAGNVDDVARLGAGKADDVLNLADDVTNKVDDIVKNADDIIDDVANNTDNIVNQADEAVNLADDVVDDVANKIDNITDKADDIVDTAQNIANETTGNKANSIYENFDTEEYFYWIEDEYSALRKSNVGNYTMNNSINNPTMLQNEIYNPTNKMRLLDQNGWIYRTGNKFNNVTDRISLNVKGDSKLVQALDDLAKQYDNFYYKTPKNAQGWIDRDDPITMYFNGKPSEELVEKIAKITQPYARGSVVGAENSTTPWLSQQIEPTKELVNELFEKAMKHNKELAQAIQMEIQRCHGTLSAGLYQAALKILNPITS